MNNERGFVTVFALCLILVVALVVKGIQESDTNHNLSAADLQTEFDLQNAADGGIYEAAEKVRVATQKGQELLPANGGEPFRKNYQRQLVTRTIQTNRGAITVTVWGERTRIQGFNRLYPSYKAEVRGDVKYGYLLFGVAQMNNERIGEKIYRRAFAYVVDGYGVNSLNKPVKPGDEAAVTNEYETVVVAPEDKDVVHFLELPSGKDN